jgi:DMSO/TMAO reductase YedYZ heme-binding membrane subunit
VSLAILVPLAVTLSLVIVAAALPRSWQDLRLWLFLAAGGAGVGVLAAGPLAWAATDAVLERANPFRSIIWRLSVRAIALGAVVIAAPMAITSGSRSSHK